MIKYFQNNKTGALISFDEETKIVNELEEIFLDRPLPTGNFTSRPLPTDFGKLRSETIGGGVEHKRPYHRKEKEAVEEKVKKDKGPQICSCCGKTVPPGKYLSKGMCVTCYSREVYRKKHGKSAKAEKIKNYECIDCFKEFKSPLSIDEVKCPVNPGHKLIQR